MSLPLPLGSAGKTTTPLLPSIQGRKYIMENNPMGITQMCFDFAGDTGRFHYTNKSGDHVLTFGLGHYVSGKFPEPGYAGRKINVPGDLYACDAAGAWFNDDTLHLTVYITDDYLGALRAQFTFRNNGVSVYMRKAAENFLQQYQGFGYGTAVDSLGHLPFGRCPIAMQRKKYKEQASQINSTPAVHNQNIRIFQKPNVIYLHSSRFRLHKSFHS
jgi:hypothetical protein